MRDTYYRIGDLDKAGGSPAAFLKTTEPRSSGAFPQPDHGNPAHQQNLNGHPNLAYATRYTLAATAHRSSQPQNQITGEMRETRSGTGRLNNGKSININSILVQLQRNKVVLVIANTRKTSRGREDSSPALTGWKRGEKPFKGFSLTGPGNTQTPHAFHLMLRKLRINGKPSTLLAVAALLVGVALLACWIPAYRATRIAPLEALRIE